VKKRWIAGSVPVLLILALAFAGCEGAVGPQGPAGPLGPPANLDGPRVVVVGAGIGGMVAALSAADALAETGGGQVILLEADYFVGGSFVIAGGGWNAVVGNWNHADNATDFSWGYSQIRRGGAAWAAAGAAGFVNHAGNTPATAHFAAFPQDDGCYRLWTRVMAFASPMRQGAFSPARWNIPMAGGITPDAGGQGFRDSSGLITTAPFGPAGSRSMELAIQRHPNIYLMLGTRAVELAEIATGYRIRTVASMPGGRNINLTADAVILATGGFSQSAEHLARFATETHLPQAYGPDSLAAQGWVRSGAAPFHLGDGIDMALAVGGAALPRMYGGTGGNLLFCWTLRSLPGAYSSVFHSPLWTSWAGLQFRNFIIVNREGDRFMSESLNHHPSGGGGGAGLWNNRLPPYYVIIPVDTTAAPWLTTAGQLRVPGVNIHSALRAAAAMPGNNEVRRANDLAGLQALMQQTAVEMGITGPTFANFMDTLVDYNARVAARNAAPEEDRNSTVSGANSLFDAPADGGFGKQAADMGIPILDGADMEFFAIRVYAGPFSNFGGVRVDWRGRLLDEDSEQLDNMVYAIGELTFRNFYNGQYPGGSALVVAPAQGYIAGRDAVYRLRGRTGIPSRIAGDDGN